MKLFAAIAHEDDLRTQPDAAGLVGRDAMGRQPFVPAFVSLYQLPQWRRGHHGAADMLVDGPEGHRVAQAAEVWPKLLGQSGRGWRIDHAYFEKRHAHDGWHHDRRGDGFVGAALGPMEHPP